MAELNPTAVAELHEVGEREQRGAGVYLWDCNRLAAPRRLGAPMTAGTRRGL